MAKKCIELADIDEAVSCADLDNLAGVVQSLVYGLPELNGIKRRKSSSLS